MLSYENTPRSQSDFFWRTGYAFWSAHSDFLAICLRPSHAHTRGSHAYTRITRTHTRTRRSHALSRTHTQRTHNVHTTCIQSDNIQNESDAPLFRLTPAPLKKSSKIYKFFFLPQTPGDQRVRAFLSNIIKK